MWYMLLSADYRTGHYSWIIKHKWLISLCLIGWTFTFPRLTQCKCLKWISHTLSTFRLSAFKLPTWRFSNYKLKKETSSQNIKLIIMTGHSSSASLCPCNSLNFSSLLCRFSKTHLVINVVRTFVHLNKEKKEKTEVTTTTASKTFTSFHKVSEHN